VGKIAALIPAAGYSSRMGLFKPLLPIASSLVLEKPIKAFRTAGVEDILVITGHKNFLLAPVLEGLGVKAVYNSRFDQGMYSSIQAGVAALPEDTEAFFLLPADYAVVSSAVISQILEKYRREPHQVFYPTYNGERGHPPLISAELLTTDKDLWDIAIETGFNDVRNVYRIFKKNTGHTPVSFRKKYR